MLGDHAGGRGEDLVRVVARGGLLAQQVEEPESCLIRAQGHLGLYAPCRLSAGAEHACDPALLVAYGRVGEGEPSPLFASATVHGQRQVLRPSGLAGECPVDQGQDVGPDLRPNVVEAPSQGCGVFVPEDLGVGIVVEKAEFPPERHEHRESRAQDKAYRRAQARRPYVGMPERRAGPVVGAHYRPYPSAPFEEERELALSVIRHGRGSRARVPRRHGRSSWVTGPDRCSRWATDDGLGGVAR